jgi:Domain of unknown function (DUF4397)
MRDRGWRRRTCRHGGLGILLVAAMVAMLVGPAAVVPAAAQDDLDNLTRVVVLHADWSLGPVDVYINHDEVLSQFAYGQVSDWIGFEPGSVRVTITTDRSGFNYNYVAFDTVYPAPAGNDYSLIVSTPLILGGVFDTSPVPDGGARVRIVQGAVSLRPVNVTANNKTVEFAEDLGYSSASGYTVMPAGTYDFDVTEAGTAETLLTAPGVVLEANTTYELVIMGQPGDANHPLELRPLADTTR